MRIGESAADAIISALRAVGLRIVPEVPTEKMIDAPRALFLFEGPSKPEWTLGRHIEMSTRKITLTEEEAKLTYVNKATRAIIAYRAMLEAADEQ
jgi:hypothetical protein